MPGADELAAVVLYYAPNGWWIALLLKFRDLNSSASVMLGEAVFVGVWVGRVRYVTGYKGCTVVTQRVVKAVLRCGVCSSVGLTVGGC